MKPTVLVNVTNHMTIAREEIFGPVLCVIAYETDEDAIRITNDTNFGLHAFVSGTDIQRVRCVVSQILAGRVAINGILDDQQAPFYPVKPRLEPNFSYRLLHAIYPAFRMLFPNQMIRADDLARAIVDVAVRGEGKRGGLVFENRDMRAMAGSLHPTGDPSTCA